MRCRDPWYREFLQQCRDRCLGSDRYCFFHGLPTFTATRRLCNCNHDVRKKTVLGAYKTNGRKCFFNGCVDMAAFIAQSECEACRTVRQGRRRVLDRCGPSDTPQSEASLLHSITHTQSPEEKVLLSKAPALYSFNVPKCFAILLRAREFGKHHNIQLTFCYAQDIPMHPGDRDLEKEALLQKRVSWLQRQLVALSSRTAGAPHR